MNADTPPPAPGRLKKAAFALVLLLAAFALLEGTLRLYLVLRWKTPLAVYTKLGYDRQPLLGFEMIPNLRDARLPSISTVCSTNSLGFRGREEFGPKKDGELRVALLGESSVFGFGASSDAASLGEQLKDLLRRAEPGRPVSVINAGIPTYNSYQVLARYQLRVLGLRPDVVVIYTGWNDLFFQTPGGSFIPNNFKKQEDFFTLDTWQTFIGNFNRANLPDWGPDGLATTMFVKRALIICGLGRAETEEVLSRVVAAPAAAPAALPADYPVAPEHRPLILQQLRDNLTTLAAGAKAHGQRVILVTLFSERDLFATDRARLNAVIREVAAATGNELLDADAVVRALPAPLGLNNAGDKYHLSDEGNRFLAGLVAQRLAAKP